MTYYENYNPHPQGKLVGDCVKRALTKATGEDYRDVKIQLNRIKREFECDAFNNPKVYEMFLKRKGFVKVSYPAQAGKKRMTVRKLAEISEPNFSYVCRCAGHLVCVTDNKYWDTWDCGEKCVYVAWVRSNYGK